MLATFIALSIVSLKFYVATFGLVGSSGQYDYIIIGAGPAGSVLTRRLVDSGRTVLLLEAGGPTQYELGGHDYFAGPVTRFDIPLFWSSLTRYEEFQWQGFGKEDVLLAKGLGGCGTHNAMLYVRCMQADVESWNMTDEGWSWREVLASYKELENYIPALDNSDAMTNIPSYHGTGGPYSITTSRPVTRDPIAAEFLSSAVHAGIPLVSDFNNPTRQGRIGVGYYDFNIDGGVRDSAARRFLAPLIARSTVSSKQRPSQRRAGRFTLNMHAEVDRILLQDTAGSPRAVGVEYTEDGVKQRAYLNTASRGESTVKDSFGVIVSAGAILTPKLLLRSGIGPKEDLEHIGIPVKKHLPMVGKHLQDHPVVGLTLKVDPALAAGYPSAYAMATHWNNYISAVEGSRASTSGSDKSPPVASSAFGVMGSAGFAAGGFLVSPYSDDPTTPDIQLTVFPMVSEPHMIQDSVKMGNDTMFDNEILDHQILITIALLKPDAKYELRLDRSSGERGMPSFHLPPGIDEYLSVRDVDTLAWGIKEVRRIAHTPPLADLARGEMSPGENYRSDSKSLSKWIRANVKHNSHWVGTARMGPTQSSPRGSPGSDSSSSSVKDKGALRSSSKEYDDASRSSAEWRVSSSVMDEDVSVVDSSFRVRGVKNLRVADASVFPIIPNGNVHSSVVMMASRAADMLIAQFKQENKKTSRRSSA